VKAIFWIRHETTDRREGNLARAIQAGARKCGDSVEIREVPDTGQPEVIPCDMVLKIGVKSRNWFRAYNKAGIPYCYFDKGYIRTRAMVWLEYWRLSVNGHQPLAYVKQAKHDAERATKLGLSFHPWRTGGDAILVDGSSGKHHYFHADRDYSQEQWESYTKMRTRLPSVSSNGFAISHRGPSSTGPSLAGSSLDPYREQNIPEAKSSKMSSPVHTALLLTEVICASTRFYSESLRLCWVTALRAPFLQQTSRNWRTHT
jgi:hypothetical protein